MKRSLLILFLGWITSLSLSAQPWSVRDLNGAPCLYRDKEPVTPIMFWQWELQEKDVRDMTHTGIQLYSMFGSHPHYAHPYWKEDGSFGMDFQDGHIRQLLAWSPGCYFLPRIFSAAPRTLTKRGI